jgi:hypothetical protein
LAGERTRTTEPVVRATLAPHQSSRPASLPGAVGADGIITYPFITNLLV